MLSRQCARSAKFNFSRVLASTNHCADHNKVPVSHLASQKDNRISPVCRCSLNRYFVIFNIIIIIIYSYHTIGPQRFERNKITYPPGRGGDIIISVSLAAQNDWHRPKQDNKRGNLCPPHTPLEFLFGLKVVHFLFPARTNLILRRKSKS